MLACTSAAVVLLQAQASASAQYRPRYITGTVFETGFRASDVGFTEQGLERFKDRVWTWALGESGSYSPTTLHALANRLRLVSDGLIPSGASNDAKLYAMSYVTGVWVKTRMRYLDAGSGVSHTGKDTSGRTVAFEKRYTWVNSQEMLRCVNFEGACRHSAVIARDLINLAAEDLGGSAHYVGGWFKKEGKGTAPMGSNHAWNLVKLPNGLWIPFDATGTARTLDQWKEQHRRFYPCPVVLDFPKSAPDFEVFFARHYGTTLDHGYGLPDDAGVSKRITESKGFVHQDFFMSWKLADWLAYDTTDVTALRQRIMGGYLRR